MLKRILLISTVLSGVLIILILLFTTPTQVGVAGILSFFILAYIFLLGLLTGLLYLSSYTFSLLTKNRVMSRPTKQMSLKKAYYYGTIAALAPVLLVAMQSFGNISFFEFGLVLIFVAIGCFLVSKRQS